LRRNEKKVYFGKIKFVSNIMLTIQNTVKLKQPCLIPSADIEIDLIEALSLIEHINVPTSEESRYCLSCLALFLLPLSFYFSLLSHALNYHNHRYLNYKPLSEVCLFTKEDKYSNLLCCYPECSLLDSIR
jgi:hypothetical protein